MSNSSPPIRSYNNAVAIITGGASGLGRAIAECLAKQGCEVILADRQIELATEVSNGIIAAGGKASAVELDVRNAAAFETVIQETRDRTGRIDYVFNNAGIGAPAIPLEDLTVEQWKSVVDINLTGAFLCTQEAFRIMKEQNPQGGRIINNGSISAHVPRPFSSPYTATKHAITGLTRSSSLDGRAYNIACGQIDIGNAETDMTARMKKGVLQANGTTSTEPTIDPDHVAQAVVYMAGLPLDANVQFMTVMATQMPFIGRG